MADMDLPAELAPLDGGFSGETFVADSLGQQVVVRIYAGRSAARGPIAVDIDAAVLRWMRGIVPVPRVLEVRRPVGELPGLLVTEFLPGIRGDLLLPTLTDDQRRVLGINLGRVLDRLAHVPTLRPGLFVDPELRIEAFPDGADSLPGWVEQHQDSLITWTPSELGGLVAVAEHAHDLLDTVERTCVVHGDFNPKNLLIDPETLGVTGVIDWEFAHSGSPYSDLGNLLRFERDEDFVSGVLSGLDKLDHRTEVDRRTEILELARAADLFALIELAARRGSNSSADAAHQLLLCMARTGDLHGAQ
jgi:aminoglycoside phosphotransferase (APT) family kinase protein